MIAKDIVKEHRSQNFLQTGLILLAMLSLFSLVGFGILGNITLPLILLIFVFGFTLVHSARPELIFKTMRGTPLGFENAPGLYRITDALCQRAGLQTRPTLWYLPQNQINAMAAGQTDRFAIGLTHGILNTLNERELIGVLAHEIAHVKNRDMGIMGFSGAMTRLTSSLGSFGQMMLLLSLPFWLLGIVEFPLAWILLVFLAPGLNGLLGLALSRTREFEADRMAVEISKDPYGLASALSTMEKAVRNPWGRFLPSSGIPVILKTHPATRERIQRLLSMAEQPRLYWGN